MELQFYGANCLSLSTKQSRLVIDDNLSDLGGKSIIKSGDIAVFTHEHSTPAPELRLLIDGPGEFEIADISVRGMAVRAHIDPEDQKTATLYKILIDDVQLLVTGHIYPELSESELEKIGKVDVLCIPVGGNGYTLDAAGALKLIKKIEPKLIIPTHYADKSLKFSVPQTDLAEALKNLAMESRETVAKLKIKPADLTDVTQLVVLEKT
jgi:L-ascorbate metabolism protein UlaG (beta-lactamase superfamily)